MLYFSLIFQPPSPHPPLIFFNVYHFIVHSLALQIQAYPHLYSIASPPSYTLVVNIHLVFCPPHLYSVTSHLASTFLLNIHPIFCPPYFDSIFSPLSSALLLNIHSSVPHFCTQYPVLCPPHFCSTSNSLSCTLEHNILQPYTFVLNPTALSYTLKRM
jgi:hypothetical protein